MAYKKIEVVYSKDDKVVVFGDRKGEMAYVTTYDRVKHRLTPLGAAARLSGPYETMSKGLRSSMRKEAEKQAALLASNSKEG